MSGPPSTWHQDEVESERFRDGEDGRHGGIRRPRGKEASNDLGLGADASSQRGLAHAVRKADRIERLYELVRCVDLGGDFPVVCGEPRLFQAALNIRVESAPRSRVCGLPDGASHHLDRNIKATMTRCEGQHAVAPVC